jgi:hypothetical protein
MAEVGPPGFSLGWAGESDLLTDDLTDPPENVQFTNDAFNPS